MLDAERSSFVSMDTYIKAKYKLYSEHVCVRQRFCKKNTELTRRLEEMNPFKITS